MPQFDHTGPNGMGARTGRGMGKCGGAGRKAAQTGAAIITPEQETAQGMAPAEAILAELERLREALSRLDEPPQ